MSAKDIGVAPPKGFRDFLPRETELRDRVLADILRVYRSYGFERVDTPAIEDLRRLQKSEGGENLGLMFRILKRGDKLDLSKPGLNPDDLVDLGLRYDLTVPLSRYYANNKESLPAIFKAVQVGPVWRAERPQAGRFRQFVQCDIDIIGGAAPAVEAELMTATQEALAAVGIQNLVLRLNDRRILLAMVANAGISEDRAAKALVLLDKLDKLGLDGVKGAFLADGFGEEATQKLITFAAKVQAMPAAERLEGVRSGLASLVPTLVFDELAQILASVKPGLCQGNTIEFDPFLVRGMGYYTGAVFEISSPEFGSSVAGGGRYDKLIGNLSGVEAPACGFSIGFERITSILEERERSGGSVAPKVAIFYDAGPGTLEAVMVAAQGLRKQGTITSIFESPRNMKNSLERLKLSGYTGFARFKSGEALSIKSLE
ncbi:MAG: histidine--tRNA ligase [Oligoflexia bacterium]|nr:histidine--tRNA ligase [Oligoflexia bacterium]